MAGNEAMRAMKCNRCKGFYEVNHGGYLSISEIDGAQIVSATKPRLDLCESCLASWRKWLSEYEKTEEKPGIETKSVDESTKIKNMPSKKMPSKKTPSKEAIEAARSTRLLA